jgi:hypothetical protein
MEDEIKELAQKLGDVYSTLNKLKKLDFSKFEISNTSSGTWSLINFIDASFKSNQRHFNEFLTLVSTEIAIRKRVKKRYYVLNSKDSLSLDYLTHSTFPNEFQSELEAFKFMTKQNKLAESSFKRKLRRNKATYAIHKFDETKDVFVKLTENDLKEIEVRLAQVEHGFF